MQLQYVFSLLTKNLWITIYKKGCEVDEEEIFIVEEVRWLMAL